MLNTICSQFHLHPMSQFTSLTTTLIIPSNFTVCPPSVHLAWNFISKNIYEFHLFPTWSVSLTHQNIFDTYILTIINYMYKITTDIVFNIQNCPLLFYLTPQIVIIRYVLFIHYTTYFCGTHSGSVGRGTTLQAGRLWVWFPMVSLEFFVDIILPATLCSWGWLSL